MSNIVSKQLFSADISFRGENLYCIVRDEIKHKYIIMRIADMDFKLAVDKTTIVRIIQS